MVGRKGNAVKVSQAPAQKGYLATRGRIPHAHLFVHARGDQRSVVGNVDTGRFLDMYISVFVLSVGAKADEVDSPPSCYRQSARVMGKDEVADVVTPPSESTLDQKLLPAQIPHTDFGPSSGCCQPISVGREGDDI